MTEHQGEANRPRADDWQSEHERKVAEIEKERAPSSEGRRPTSDEDLAADRTPGDEDVVGDDRSGPGQNSDRLPQ